MLDAQTAQRLVNHVGPGFARADFFRNAQIGDVRPQRRLRKPRTLNVRRAVGHDGDGQLFGNLPHDFVGVGENVRLLGEERVVFAPDGRNVGARRVNGAKPLKALHKQIVLRHFPALIGVPAGIVDLPVVVKRLRRADAQPVEQRAQRACLRRFEIQKRVVGVHQNGLVSHTHHRRFHIATTIHPSAALGNPVEENFVV